MLRGVIQLNTVVLGKTKIIFAVHNYYTSKELLLFFSVPVTTGRARHVSRDWTS